MLTKTFCHIEGISAASEKSLWDSGITHWDHFFEKHDTLSCLSKSKIAKIAAELHHSKKALLQNDLRYFQNLLPSKEHWRLAPLGKIAYVDIETTGMSRYDSAITVIGIFDGTACYSYINGDNLAAADAKLREFEILVTFNGKQFDLPFIESHFSCSYDVVHLDLRYMLKEIGLSGGLKSIERQLGIARADNLIGVDGFEAVRLWQRHCRGDKQALDKLLQYNQEDIVNLKTLLEHYVKAKTEQLFS